MSQIPGVRDLIEAIAQRCLGGGVPPDAVPGVDDGAYAQRFMLSWWGFGGDALIDKADQGVYARMPSRADSTALPYIGRDRQIVPGPNEPEATYRVRLRRALTTWRQAGTDRGVLGSLLAYLAPAQPLARAVTVDTPLDATATWRTYVPGGSGVDLTLPPATIRVAANFDWDSLSPTLPRGWWRWWVILFSVSPDDWCHAGPTWGSGTWAYGDGSRSWGFDLPADFFTGLRAILTQWKRAGSLALWIIVSFDQTLLDPAQPSTPDGHWGHWGKVALGAFGITRHVRARNANARYVDGSLA